MERMAVKRLVSIHVSRPPSLMRTLGACIWVGDTLAAFGAFHCLWLASASYAINVRVHN